MHNFEGTGILVFVFRNNPTEGILLGEPCLPYDCIEMPRSLHRHLITAVSCDAETLVKLPFINHGYHLKQVLLLIFIKVRASTDFHECMGVNQP